MENYLLEWAGLLLRWLHVVATMAWIGASFYFVFLDNHLTPPEDPGLRQAGASGELWAVHGGGFYHPVKYAVAPPQLPTRLHWFYWESYATWLSGFALLLVMYVWQPQLYLVDRNVFAWPSTTLAVVAALACLVVFWLLYDGLCRTVGQWRHGDVWVGLGVALLVLGWAHGLNHWFAGRAAFLWMGVALATAMTANVAHWIIPGQRKAVAALRAGQPVDPIHARRGKQRSVHNTYFTLPVVFAMLSPHFGGLHQHPQRAWLLVLLLGAGVLIRQCFLSWHAYRQGRGRLPWGLAVLALGVLGLCVWLGRPVTPDRGSAPVVAHTTGARAQSIVAQRCVVCHGAELAAKGVRLDSVEALQGQAAAVYRQAVVLQNMPLNNATGMTAQERTELAQWLRPQLGLH